MSDSIYLSNEPVKYESITTNRFLADNPHRSASTEFQNRIVEMANDSDVRIELSKLYENYRKLHIIYGIDKSTGETKYWLTYEERTSTVRFRTWGAAGWTAHETEWYRR